MPFRSRAQQRYLFAKHPDIARRFADDTPASAYKHLPQHVGKHHAHRLIDEMKRRSHGHKHA